VFLRAGKHPPPYCIVVEFPNFRGIVGANKDRGSIDSDQRLVPFPNHPHWVPVYREKFTAARSDLPSWIVKKQEPKHCWRQQFPLDLCRAMTCHRAQGQTYANCSVGIDLGLDNPDGRVPPDIRSILYVALTRATQLKDVFVANICNTAWEKICDSEDTTSIDKSLHSSAREFATNKGMLSNVTVSFVCVKPPTTRAAAVARKPRDSACFCTLRLLFISCSERSRRL